MQIYQRYLEDNEPEMLQGNGKNWLSSRDWLRGNHLEGVWWGPKKARRPLQMVHGWLPTRGLIAKREYPGTEGEKCPNCEVKETTWHALGECNHASSCTARDKGMQEINAIIDCEAPDEKTKKGKHWLRWIYWASQGRWCRKGAPDAPVMDEAEPLRRERGGPGVGGHSRRAGRTADMGRYHPSRAAW